MKTRLHKPRTAIWNVALLLFIVGMVAAFVPVPAIGGFAFYLVALSAVLLLLGTWVI